MKAEFAAQKSSACPCLGPRYNNTIINKTNIIKDIGGTNAHQMGHILAHEMGHGLGMKHDGPEAEKVYVFENAWIA